MSKFIIPIVNGILKAKGEEPIKENEVFENRVDEHEHDERWIEQEAALDLFEQQY